MKLYRMITVVFVMLLSLTVVAQQTTMTINDEERHQTITVTAVGDDIVRIDVVPDGWSGERLPSLALDKTAKAEVKIEEWGNDIKMMRTINNMKVAYVNGTITVGCGNNFYITDLCDRKSNTVTASAVTRSI